MPPRRPRGECPPDHSHAKSLTCYSQHRCGCDKCCARNTAYGRWKRRTPDERRALMLIPAVGTRRRMQALQWLGYSPKVLAAHLGLDYSLVWRWAKSENVTRLTAARVRKLYDELSMRPLDPQTKSERISVNKSRAKARREGWVGPLAWDDVDIDDPAAEPALDGTEDEPGWIVAELAHLYGLGESSAQAAAVLKREPKSLARLARRYKRPDIARWLGESDQAA